MSERAMGGEEIPGGVSSVNGASSRNPSNSQQGYSVVPVHSNNSLATLVSNLQSLGSILNSQNANYGGSSGQISLPPNLVSSLPQLEQILRKNQDANSSLPAVSQSNSVSSALVQSENINKAPNGVNSPSTSHDSSGVPSQQAGQADLLQRLLLQFRNAQSQQTQMAQSRQLHSQGGDVDLSNQLLQSLMLQQIQPQQINVNTIQNDFINQLLMQVAGNIGKTQEANWALYQMQVKQHTSQSAPQSISYASAHEQIKERPSAMARSTHRGNTPEPTPFPELIKVPCRARGMTLDHNAKTAYFSIPDGTEHGQDLVCSHQLCREQGVKFQFCAFCQCPVAKRNFRNRHLHIDGTNPAIAQRDVVKKRKARGPEDSEPSVTNNKIRNEWNDPDPYVVKGQSSGVVPNTDSSQDATSSSKVSGIASLNSDTEPARPMTDRERKWAALLESRPIGGSKKEIEMWLSRVMIISSREPSKEV